MSERAMAGAQDDMPAPVRPGAAPYPPCSFGDFVLDPARRELRRDGEPVRVEPRALDLLWYLIRHRDRVVSRDEILDALWGDDHVSDAALSYCVKTARKAIGDSGSAQHSIATIQRRGFRFVADVALRPTARRAVSAEGASGARGPFVGREAIMAHLGAALAASGAGHARVVLLSGEPGIGKTRITEELSRAAADDGVSVLTGRCYESAGAPPFWPWAQMVRAHVAQHGRDATIALMQGAASDLAAWEPELGSGRDGPPTPSPSDGDARFRLFDGMTGFLRRAAVLRPLLLVLDDLQWADTPTLLLLRFVARELGNARVLILAVYRDTDVSPPHPLLSCTADLVRVAGTERLHLDGLTPADLARFIEAATGTAPPALVERIHQQTGGNPFFATESVRLLASADDAKRSSSTAMQVPRTVREVVTHRLESLSPAAQRLLRIAAVLGREFDVADVRRIRDSGRLPSRAEILRALDEARAARVIEPLADDGRFRFVHDLVRETIYDSLPSDRRATLHERVGRSIERARQGDLGPYLALLAHHFACAAVGSDPRRAIEYARRAGDRDARLLAYEEAAAHYERALALGDQPSGSRRSAVSDADQDALLLALGENQWKSGDFGRAREIFQRVAARAREREDPDLLARAALGFGGGFRGFDVQVIDPDLVALLEEAFVRLPGRPSALRGRVMARLAISLYHVPGTLERRHELSAQAVQVARRTRDDDALAAALYSRHWAIWGPDTLDDRVATAQAMVRLADKTGQRETALNAHRFLVVDSLERGERAAMDAHLARCVALAEELRQPYYRWYAAQLVAMRALIAGHVDDSERLLDQALAIGRRADSRNVELAYQSLLFWIRREQGRALEVEPTMRAAVERLPAAASWRCALALLYAEAGRHDDARRQIDTLAADEFAVVRRDAFWLSAIGMVADACAEVGDADRARVLYRLLSPYGGRVAEVAVGGGCLGAVDRLLGRLAALNGLERAAAEHFARALRIERSFDAPLLVARTERAQASAL